MVLRDAESFEQVRMDVSPIVYEFGKISLIENPLKAMEFSKLMDFDLQYIFGKLLIYKTRITNCILIIIHIKFF